MVVASIDIQGGKAVQLKQGRDLVLQKDNLNALIAEFDIYGEVAIIDLDAAMGKGNNYDLIKPLLQKGNCRVGGGIRTVADAEMWIKAGAEKVIIGSSAFKNTDTNGNTNYALQTGFLENLKNTIGREHIIIAVDARNGSIVVDGWKTDTGLPLPETAVAVAPYTCELLFTSVAYEGMMGGPDFDAVRQLRNVIDTFMKNNKHSNVEITVAGGVSNLSEIEKLAQINCSVQLGMALYTGAVSLPDGFVASLNWEKGQKFLSKNGEISLLPLIAQALDGTVLMLGWTDKEALDTSFSTGHLCFHSRSRDELWLKGRHSGKTLDLVKIRADCDRDAVLAIVRPQGEVCHKGTLSCFGRLL
ncbi:MAG: phosphoribosyl-ATP diphosphatase [Spirochaetaceae bacterium]|jgi:phosphoribosyl-ATP pyrophosphohydrolase/phosphoribosyl-AMP cyclohydrolase|nr:phosphoribosyl-ATP diphosphatase [Spirochaetaceae bacterium]